VSEIGDRISRERALRIARKTIERAELERLEDCAPIPDFSGLAFIAQSELDGLRARIAALEAENAALKAEIHVDNDWIMEMAVCGGEADERIAALEAQVAELQAKLHPTCYHDVDAFYLDEEEVDGE
jgi:polyhydroxyalkanoate synthesis regulator phasin